MNDYAAVSRIALIVLVLWFVGWLAQWNAGLWRLVGGFQDFRHVKDGLDLLVCRESLALRGCKELGAPRPGTVIYTGVLLAGRWVGGGSAARSACSRYRCSFSK